MRELAAQCDVLLENYKVGDLARYGLGYEDLAKINPGIVYCSVTGFGQTGPYKDRPGYDFMAQGMGGLMSITGEPDDQPGGGPQRCGVPIVDLTTGMYATIAICAALANRAVTGKGQYIDVALLDCCVAYLANQGMNYLATGESPERIGNAHPNIVPYQTFKTADGAIILACGNDNLFNKFCEAAGCTHLVKDPRFSTNAERVKNRAEITRLLNEVFAQRTDQGVGQAARRCRCRQRPDQQPAAGVRGAAGDRARPEDRAAARGGRLGAAGGEPDAVFGHAAQARSAAAGARPAYGRNPACIVEEERRRNCQTKGRRRGVIRVSGRAR